MAHVDGALAFHGEEHHHLAVHVEHHHTDCALVVVGADGELPLGGIGINLRFSFWLTSLCVRGSSFTTSLALTEFYV